jgi:hypothetical protein
MHGTLAAMQDSFSEDDWGVIGLQADCKRVVISSLDKSLYYYCASAVAAAAAAAAAAAIVIIVTVIIVIIVTRVRFPWLNNVSTATTMG